LRALRLRRDKRADQGDLRALDEDDPFPQRLLQFPAEGAEVKVGLMRGRGEDLEGHVQVGLPGVLRPLRVACPDTLQRRRALPEHAHPAEVADEQVAQCLNVILRGNIGLAKGRRRFPDDFGGGIGRASFRSWAYGASASGLMGRRGADGALMAC
jgi:hypothetical protein